MGFPSAPFFCCSLDEGDPEESMQRGGKVGGGGEMAVLMQSRQGLNTYQLG